MTIVYYIYILVYVYTDTFSIVHMISNNRHKYASLLVAIIIVWVKHNTKYNKNGLCHKLIFHMQDVSDTCTLISTDSEASGSGSEMGTNWIFSNCW